MPFYFPGTDTCMRWPDHAIWWHAYPLGFVGAEREALPADTPPEPRLGRLADWLDHLVELGCNGLVLGPVFASETHGYDTVDHYRIDPRLGTEDDLKRLIDDASQKGVRILLDGVFNHVGRSFEPFRDVASQATTPRTETGSTQTCGRSKATTASSR